MLGPLCTSSSEILDERVFSDLGLVLILQKDAHWGCQPKSCHLQGKVFQGFVSWEKTPTHSKACSGHRLLTHCWPDTGSFSDHLVFQELVLLEN